jgi:alkylation response protein AidB-like acyl-CoA dehydrogenase
MAQLAELGFFGLLVPEEYGGVAYDAVAYALALEELARVSAGLSVMISVHNSVCCWPIARYGTESRSKRFLPGLRPELGAFPSHPSPAPDRTRERSSCSGRGAKATRTCLNGTKNWVTNGAFAGAIVLFARTGDPATRASPRSVVTPDLPGSRSASTRTRWALRPRSRPSCAFQDCRVRSRTGWATKARASRSRCRRSTAAASGSRRRRSESRARRSRRRCATAKTRETFGRKLHEHQPVAFMLAEMERRVAAGRLLMMRAAWKRSQGTPHLFDASMAKLYASEAATYCAHRAIQVHGGYGYVKEYPVERYYRDARVTEIYEGASEIQRIVIARELVRQAEAAEAAHAQEVPS